jgi:hypothetical protein
MRTFIFISTLVSLGPSVVVASNTAHIAASYQPPAVKYRRSYRAADWAEKMTEKPGEQMKVAREVHNTGAHLDGNTEGGSNFLSGHVGHAQAGEESPSAGNLKSEGDGETGIDGQRGASQPGSASQIEEAAPRGRNSHLAGSGPLKSASHMEGAGQQGGISRSAGGEPGRASQTEKSGQRGENSHSAGGGESGSASPAEKPGQRGGSSHPSESGGSASASQPEGAGQREERSRSSVSGLPGSSPQRTASQGAGFRERRDKSRYRKPKRQVSARLQAGEY